MAEKIIIYGGGGHAKVVLDAMQDNNINPAGIIDSKYEGQLLGVTRYKNIPQHLEDAKCVIAIGDNTVRKNISVAFKKSYVNVIHPTALLSRNVKIGVGCMVLHRSVIQAGSSIEDHVIINTGAQVDHDCHIGSYVHLAPGTLLCGNISVGEGTLIGAGAVVKPGVRIGAWVTIGSGAVVVKDIPDFAVVVGNPGRIIKYIQA